MNNQLHEKINGIILKGLSDVYSEIDSAEKKLSELKEQISIDTELLNDTILEREKVIADIEKRIVYIEDENKKSTSLKIDAENRIEQADIRETQSNNAVNYAVNKLNELNVEITSLSKERRERVEQEILAANTRVAEIQKELEARLPEISKREAALKEKENDLNIVEARWKKLYGDKGLGFKV